MNRSGDAVAYWKQSLSIALSDLIIVLDEIQLPLGRLRLQPKGSGGGHNGLAHVIERVGSTEIPRLRFGIDKRFPRGAQATYVLSPFSPEEEVIVAAAVPIAAETLLRWAREGVASAATFAGRYQPSRK
jgi:PTH1 family peptidyl-tRNA hydrolase